MPVEGLKELIQASIVIWCCDYTSSALLYFLQLLGEALINNFPALLCSCWSEAVHERDKLSSEEGFTRNKVSDALNCTNARRNLFRKHQNNYGHPNSGSGQFLYTRDLETKTCLTGVSLMTTILGLSDTLDSLCLEPIRRNSVFLCSASY